MCAAHGSSAVKVFKKPQQTFSILQLVLRMYLKSWSSGHNYSYLHVWATRYTDTRVPIHCFMSSHPYHLPTFYVSVDAFFPYRNLNVIPSTCTLHVDTPLPVCTAYFDHANSYDQKWNVLHFSSTHSRHCCILIGNARFIPQVLFEQLGFMTALRFLLRSLNLRLTKSWTLLAR